MLVVDSSLIVAALVDEEHTAFADDCVRRHVDSGLIAPGLLRWEFANVLNIKRRKGLMTMAQATGLNAAFEGLAIAFPSDDASLDQLLATAAQTSLTAYDAAYVAMAIQSGAPLATLDRAMARAAVAAGVRVQAPFA